MEPNGPYIVTGPISIADADGNEIRVEDGRTDGNEIRVEDGRTAKLCRWGHSGKKPYCDDTHRRVDFVSRPTFLPEPVDS